MENLSKETEMMHNEEKHETLPAPVYFIEASKDDTVLIGMDVKITTSNQITTISWLDTITDRRMTAQETRKDNDTFSFARSEKEGGGFYRFTPMTLNIYKNYVRPKLKNGEDFNDETDLINAFLESKKNI